MKRNILMLYLCVFSLFLGSNSISMAMEVDITNKEQSSVQIYRNWLKNFELASLAKNPKNLKLDEYLKVRDALNNRLEADIALYKTQ